MNVDNQIPSAPPPAPPQVPRTLPILHTTESFAALTPQEQELYRNIVANLASITQVTLPSPPPPPTDPNLLQLISAQQETQSAFARFLATSTTSASTTVINAPKLKEPPTFDGTDDEVADWVTDMKLELNGEQHRSSSNSQKVLFLRSYLKGKARTYVNTAFNLATKPAFLNSPTAFLDEIVTRFGDPFLKSNAGEKLRKIKQGKKSVMDYVIEFRNLSQLVPHYPEPVLIDIFRSGLSHNIQITMAKETSITTYNLDRLISFATSVDNSLRSINKSFHHSNSQPISDPDAMDIDATTTSRPRGPLSEKEKEYRRKNGLCMYCGAAGHKVEKCGLLAAKNNSGGTRIAEVETSSAVIKTDSAYIASPTFNFKLEDHLILPITLQTASQPIHTFALVDSGSMTNAIDSRFVASHQLPLKLKASPRTVRGADGQPLVHSQITHSTLPIIVNIKSHQESLQFDVTRLGQYSIILGIPWLKTHNPSFNWTSHQMKFDSIQCQRHSHSAQEIITGIRKSSVEKVISTSFLRSPSINLLSSSDIQLATISSPETLVHLQENLPLDLPQLEPLEEEITKTLDDAPSTSTLATSTSTSTTTSKSATNIPSLPTLPPAPTASSSSTTSSSTSSSKFELYTNYEEFRASLDEGDVISAIFMSPTDTGADIHLSSIDPSTNSSPIPPNLPKEYQDYADVFDKRNADKLPPHRPFDHEIILENGSKLPFGPIYQLSQTEMEEADKYLQENLAKGFIRPSTSSAGAPILFVRKKDGTLRFCVDYRALNRITIKNRYPLPLITESLERLKDAAIYSKIDLRGAYNLVRIASGHEHYTAFRHKSGLYEYLVMPFGLTNAPATFQSFMNDIFRPFLDKFVIVYLDDILIYSKDPEEHVQQVRKVLQVLRENQLYAKAEKCEFFTKEVEFLGYVVSPQGIKMDPKKVSAITEWPVPTSVTEVLGFIGFTNFYRRFIWNYSKLAAPLTNLTRKDVVFDFDDTALHAFNSLKEAFTTAPILAHFQPNRQSFIETDSSDFAISAVISQKGDDGHLHPISFYARKLSQAELKYGIGEKELLAIVSGIKQWRCYLEGNVPFVVYSDHSNLVDFTTTKVLTRRQARWAEILASYDFEIVIRPGSKNGKADALSRRPDFAIGTKASDSTPDSLINPSVIKFATSDFNSEPLNPVDAFNSAFDTSIDATSTSPSSASNAFNTTSLFKSPTLPTLEISPVNAEETPLDQQILTALEHDTSLTKILQLLRNPIFPLTQEDSKLVEHFTFSTTNFLLYHNQIYIPDDKAIKLQIIRQAHDSFEGGHFGQQKTYEKISRHYYWPGLRAYVNDYVLTCDLCARSKTPRHKKFGLLQPLPTPTGPWKSISMDYIVKLPLSPSGNDSILVVIDRFTKMAHFIPTKESSTASDLATLFIHHIYRLHGLPLDIVSDRGSTFTSSFWSSLLQQLQIQQNLSTSFHQQTDGQTERTNQTLEQYLRIYINYQQNNWESLLPLAEFSYNDSIQSSTKFSPFFANYAFNPISALSHLPSTISPTVPAHQLLTNIQQTQSQLTDNLSTAKEAMEKYYNRKVQEDPNFEVGDFVWLLSTNYRTQRPSNKLDFKRLGPYKIIDKSNSNYTLALPPSLKIHPTFHVSLLEPYHPNTLPDRIQPPPPPEIIDGEEELEVKEVLDSKISRKKLYYLVEWSGYNASDRTWEPAENLKNSQELVEEFHKKYPFKPSSLAPGTSPPTNKPLPPLPRSNSPAPPPSQLQASTSGTLNTSEPNSSTPEFPTHSHNTRRKPRISFADLR